MSKERALTTMRHLPLLQCSRPFEYCWRLQPKRTGRYTRWTSNRHSYTPELTKRYIWLNQKDFNKETLSADYIRYYMASSKHHEPGIQTSMDFYRALAYETLQQIPTYTWTIIFYCYCLLMMLSYSHSGVKPLNELKRQLSQKYEMTDLGEVQQFLGIQIFRNRATRTIQICQSTYIRKILTKFGMDKCNEISTPMEQTVLRSNNSTSSLEDQHYYQSVVGSVMHAMLGTRVDLAYSVSTLSKFNINPADEHLVAAKRALRYLQPTSNFGITYR